jgi:hypothetical protein
MDNAETFERFPPVVILAVLLGLLVILWGAIFAVAYLIVTAT